MTSSPQPTATLSGSDAYFNLMKSNLSNQVPRPATPSRQAAAAAVASSLVAVAFYLISILWSVWRFLLISAKHLLRLQQKSTAELARRLFLYLSLPPLSSPSLHCLPCLLTNCQQLVIAADSHY